MPKRWCRGCWIAALVLPLFGIAGLLMVAKEHYMEQQNSPFAGTDSLSLSQAVAEDDVWQISQQATAGRLHVRGDLQITLLQWAILQQRPGSVQALIQAGQILGNLVWRATGHCIRRRWSRMRNIYACYCNRLPRLIYVIWSLGLRH